MSNSVPVAADTQPSEPCLVVFGRDEAGKPHASWFDAQSADLAMKAADLMNMRVLKVETEEHKALARQLAPGRVFASGRAFTPFARANLYSKLVELAGGATGLTAVQASTKDTAEAHRPADGSVNGIQFLAAMLDEPNGAAPDRSVNSERTGYPAACANTDHQPSATRLRMTVPPARVSKAAREGERRCGQRRLTLAEIYVYIPNMSRVARSHSATLLRSIFMQKPRPEEA
jgi:hypothetical protein